MDAQIKLQQPLPGELLPSAPVLNQLTDGPDIRITADVMNGWPTTFIDTSRVYNIHAEWILEDVTVNPGGYTWEFVFHPDVSGVPESGLIELAGSEVKIYRLQ